MLFFLPTVISDAKLLLEKMNEFGLGQGKIPTISFGIAIAEPDLLNTVSADMVQGVIAVVANWGSKGHEKLIDRLNKTYGEPWMTQNAISTYGDMWIFKTALENAGKADREAVANAIRNLDEGPSPYYPGGELKFDKQGNLLAVFGQFGAEANSFNLPTGLALDAEGNIYVADSFNHRVIKFGPLE